MEQLFPSGTARVNNTGACLKITTGDISIDISEKFVYKLARN
jgi:hypothetical protein